MPEKLGGEVSWPEKGPSEYFEATGFCKNWNDFPPLVPLVEAHQYLLQRTREVGFTMSPEYLLQPHADNTVPVGTTMNLMKMTEKWLPSLKMPDDAYSMSVTKG